MDVSVQPKASRQRAPPGRTLRLPALLLLALAPLAQAEGLSPAESGRIEYLLASVAALPDARFIRNGESYDARAAVEHMRLKLRMAGAHVKSAEDFIRYCATASSVSGRPYEIRLPDGSLVPSAVFLRDKLRQFDDRRTGGG